MKNVILFRCNVKANSFWEHNLECSHCDLFGFVSHTPNGGDPGTCPLCGDNPDSTYYDDEYVGEYPYCNNCNIIYDICCIHKNNGCTESTYNTHLIGEWEYKGEKYIGTPQFENINERNMNIKEIKILKWFCPNNGKICSNALLKSDRCMIAYSETYFLKYNIKWCDETNCKLNEEYLSSN
jgi:hypothetical protein